MKLHSVLHEGTTYDVLREENKLKLAIDGITKHVFPIMSGLTTQEEMFESAMCTMIAYINGTVNGKRICGTCMYGVGGVCQAAGDDWAGEISTDYTCDKWAEPYLTCNICSDKETCDCAGDDPWNMNGECLAIK